MTLIAMAVFLTLLFTTKYMSLSSCVSSMVCPLALMLLGAESKYVLIVSLMSALLVVARHKENIRKLLSGTESKFSFSSH